MGYLRRRRPFERHRLQEAGWTANKDTVAKFVNKLPLDGPTDLKVAVIKPGRSRKMVGLSLGDSPIDLIATGVPLSDVCVVVSIVNTAHSGSATPVRASSLRPVPWATVPG